MNYQRFWNFNFRRLLNYKRSLLHVEMSPNCFNHLDNLSRHLIYTTVKRCVIFIDINFARLYKRRMIRHRDFSSTSSESGRQRARKELATMS